MNGSRVTIGSNVRRLRDMAGLSQDELAEKTGLSQKTIWTIEAGLSNGHPSTRRKLAQALGVNPQDLWPAEQQAN